MCDEARGKMDTCFCSGFSKKFKKYFKKMPTYMHQGSANYYLGAKPDLLPSFVNKVLLGQSHTLSFPYISGSSQATGAELRSGNKKPYGLYSHKYLLPGLFRKSLPTPDRYHLFSFKSYFFSSCLCLFLIKITI